MTNPVEVERRFLELQQRLTGNLSFRHQWLLIGDFLKLIKGHFTTYDTHCEQIAEQFPVFTHPLSFTGTDPDQLKSVLELVSDMHHANPSLNGLEYVSKAIDSLTCATAFLYICLDEYESANSILFGIEDRQNSLRGAANPEEYIDAAENLAIKHNLHSVAGRLKTLAGWFQQIEQHKKNSLFIPVVENLGHKVKAGRLRRLTATVLSDNETQDTFRNSYTVVGAESEDAGIREEAIRATRKLINDTHPELKEQFFKIQFEYTIPMGLHEGRSSELACCLTAYSAILDVAKSRERYLPQNRVAVTGCIENDHRVGKVDADGLAAKVQAAFFSRMEYLVVPEQQKKRFVEQLALLKELYPNRKLTLIGLEDPKAFFFDRRISIHRLDSVTKYLAKRVWQQKFSLAGVATIVILLAVIGRLWYGPIDQNPVTGVFEGQLLKLYNKSGAEVTSREVGTGRHSYSNQNGSEDLRPQVQLYDIVGDGVNELFWYQVSNNPEIEHNVLRAWSVTGDSLIWELSLNFELSFPRKNSIVDNEYHVDEFHITEDSDGAPLIVANANLHSFFPNIVFTANARNGDIRQKYVHTGHFYDVALADVNDDGVDEFIGTGVNNALWSAVVAVLDMENLQGHGPLEGDYIVEEFERAKEMHYVLVPKTIVGQYYDPIQKMSYGDRIRFNDGEDLLNVRFRDAGPSDFPEGAPAFIIIYFNTDLEVEGIGTEDKYDILARKLYQEGKIPFEPDYEYFEAFEDSLVYVE